MFDYLMQIKKIFYNKKNKSENFTEFIYPTFKLSQKIQSFTIFQKLFENRLFLSNLLPVN